MKIAVVASGHVPSKWAHSINTVKHAQAFKDLNHDVELLTVERHVEKTNKRKIADVYDWYGIDEVPIRYFQDKTYHYWGEHSFWQMPINVFDKVTLGQFIRINHPEKEMGEYIVGKGFDACYARSNCIVLENLDRGIPTVMETHNFQPERNYLLRKVIALSDNDYLRGVVTIHESIKVALVRLGVPQNKIRVIVDAVDIKPFDEIRDSYDQNSLRKEFGIPLRKMTLGYVGHLYKGRGVEDIVEAAGLAEDMSFVIVGGREQELNIFRNIVKSRKLDNIVFTGHLPYTQVPKYLLACDALIMPYTKETPTWRHMSPIKMFEYLASGRPIIATDLPVIRNILKEDENAFFIKENSPQDILHVLEKLTDHPELSDRFKENNLNLAKQYTYSNRCKKILEMF